MLLQSLENLSWYMLNDKKTNGIDKNIAKSPSFTYLIWLTEYLDKRNSTKYAWIIDTFMSDPAGYSNSY